MSGPRWAIIVGIVVVGGTITYVMSRDDASGPSAPVEPPGSAAPARAAIAAPEGPTLGSGSDAPQVAVIPNDAAPAPAPVIAAASQVAFRAQTRDPSWAAATEAEIKRRLGGRKTGTLQATECHHDQCELTIGGRSDAVAATLADLESPRGLRGFARSVLLTAPEERDGTMVIRAYAQFDRSVSAPSGSGSGGR